MGERMPTENQTDPKMNEYDIEISKGKISKKMIFKERNKFEFRLGYHWTCSWWNFIAHFDYFRNCCYWTWIITTIVGEILYYLGYAFLEEDIRIILNSLLDFLHARVLLRR